MSIMWITKHAKWVLVVFAVLVAFGMLFTTRQGGMSGCHEGNYVGSVNGEDIPTGAFQQELKMYAHNEELRTGKAPEGQQMAQIRNGLFENKVQSILIQKMFDDYQLRASVDEMQEYLLSHPQEVAGSLRRYEGPDRVPSFLRDSTFDPTRFQNWMQQDSVYDRIGMRALEEQLKVSMVPQLQLQQLLRSQVHRTDLEEAFNIEMKEDLGKIKFYQVPADSFPIAKEQISEADLQAEFKANPDSFYFHDEAAQLGFVRLPVLPSAKDTALMRDFAMELKQRARKGENFAELAKSYSNDPGSADSGGRLGGFQPRTTWVPAFSDAAFALAPGEISDPVLTPFGYHVILLNAKKTDGTTEMADVSHILLKITAGTETTDSLTDVAEKVKGEAEQSNLEAAAKSHGLTVEKTPVFEKGAELNFRSYLQGVQSFAFSAHEKKSKISDVLQNDEGIYVFERGLHFDKGRDFDRARERIAKGLARKQQMEMARKEIEQVRSDIVSQDSKPQIGKATLDSTNLIAAETFVPAFGFGSPELVAAFHQKLGEWGPTRTTLNAAVIAKVVQSQPLNADVKLQKARAAVAQGDMPLMSALWQQWAMDLPKTAKVENNLDMVYRN